MIYIIVLNILFVLFLMYTGSKRNIESRTEREAKILEEENKKNLAS